MSIDTFLLSSDTTDLDYPEIRPTLDLNFARVKALDPRITFTRSSGGSYVGADGLIKLAGVNEARFDHDPYTGESLGLLVEESRTNLLKYSNSFSTGGVGNWTTVSQICVFTQNVTGPDGVANSAWTIDDQSTLSDGAGFEQSVSITPSASTNYCLSVFAKKGTATYFDFYVFFTGSSTKGTFFRYNFSTNTISVSSADGGGISPTIFGKIEYPNGWYRLYFVVNDANSGLNNTLQYRIYPASRDLGLTGTTLFYGAQLEEGSFPTSYIPTEGSTRTRASDNAIITGKNFSEWYRPDEGSFYSSFYPKFIGNLTIMSATEGLFSTNRIHIGRGTGSDGNINSIISKDGVSQVFILIDNFNTYSGEYPIKTAVSISNNNFLGLVGYNQIIKSSTINMPSVNLLSIGSRGSGGNLIAYLNGTISRLTYYPKRLPNAQLQALTR